MVLLHIVILSVFAQCYIIVCSKSCLRFTQLSCWCNNPKASLPFHSLVSIHLNEISILLGNVLCIIIIAVWLGAVFPTCYQTEKRVLELCLGVKYILKATWGPSRAFTSWGQIGAEIKMRFPCVPVEQRLPCCLRKPVCISHAMQPRWNTLDCH